MDTNVVLMLEQSKLMEAFRNIEVKDELVRIHGVALKQVAAKIPRFSL